MKRRLLTARWMRWSLVLATATAFGILPSGCEVPILRFAVPFLLNN